MVIETKDLCKYYGDGNNRVKALDQVSVEVEKGEFIGVVGKSGSGKSTLLNMIGGLDHPTRGTIRIGDEDISEMNDEQLTKMRRSKIGFIFQNYNLMPVLNVYENIILPVQLDGKKADKEYIDFLLETLGLEEKKKSLPASLSGGQQQRTAIARALTSKPEIVLADEPTGNLDAVTGGEVIGMLRHMNEVLGQTIIIVTHDRDIAKELKRIIKVVDGRVLA
jgi:ABC-type antimicrobial peptide transport system, ATPase component